MKATDNVIKATYLLLILLYSMYLFIYFLLISLLLLENINAFAFHNNRIRIGTKFGHRKSSALNLWGSKANRIAYGCINERNLYGRVPFDDWLFTNWKLTDPNLLKKTYLEAVSVYN